MEQDNECKENMSVENYEFFSEFLSGNTIRKMQQKSIIIPDGKNRCIKTLYSHGVEISSLSETISALAFSQDYMRAYAADRYMISDELLYAGIVRSSGQPPFGFSADNALKNWFRENLPVIELGSFRAEEILNSRMKEDLVNFSGTKMSVRFLVRYTSMNFSPAENFMKVITDADSYVSDGSVMYSELDELHFSDKRKPAASYILESASYIVTATSVIDDAVSCSSVLSGQIIKYLRENEDFPEDITDDEYHRYCKLVNALDKCSCETEADMVHRWMIMLRKEMCTSAAWCFARNYRLICSGKYKGNLISDSWCRILLPFFKKLRIILTDSSGYAELSFRTQKIITGLADSIVKAAVRYDTSEKLSYNEKRILNFIPEKYRDVYHSCSVGKDEGEKLYLRILMALDYICDMTDCGAEEIYSKLC